MLKWLSMEEANRGYLFILHKICLSKDMFSKTKIKRDRIKNDSIYFGYKMCVCVMLCKRSNVSYTLSIISKWRFDLVIDTHTYYILSFIKQKNNCFHKLRYKRYLELIYRCLSHDMCTELTHMRILYGEIICVYIKAHISNP